MCDQNLHGDGSDDHGRVRDRAQRSHDFAVLPGYEVPDLEEVVERNDAFLVVRKKAGAAEVAAELDPRS